MGQPKTDNATDDRRTADNMGLAKVAVQWLIEHFCFVSSVVLIENFVLRIRHLRQAPERWAKLYLLHFGRVDFMGRNRNPPAFSKTEVRWSVPIFVGVHLNQRAYFVYTEHAARITITSLRAAGINFFPLKNLVAVV